MITEPTLLIEPKGFPTFTAPNRLHIIMASNSDWVVPASLQSRRWFVLNVSPIRRGDRAYFTALWRQMDDEGGLAAMLHDLLHDDLSDFDHRDIPTTEGLIDQRKLSLPIPEKWWQDILSRGYVLVSKHNCPSSEFLGQRARKNKGGSGTSIGDVRRSAVGAAGDDWQWSVA